MLGNGKVGCRAHAGVLRGVHEGEAVTWGLDWATAPIVEHGGGHPAAAQPHHVYVTRL